MFKLRPNTAHLCRTTTRVDSILKGTAQVDNDADWGLSRVNLINIYDLLPNVDGFDKILTIYVKIHQIHVKQIEECNVLKIKK